MSQAGDHWKKVEDAVKAACAYYAVHDKDGNRTARGEGRASIRKREPGRHVVRGELTFTTKGDVDFSGDADGAAFYAEVKSAHEQLKLSDLMKREHQLKKLRTTAARGCTSGFIIAWMPEWECWWVPFRELRDYFDNPWRQSITRDMTLAYGTALPIKATDAGMISIRFLDSRPVPREERDQAIARVNLERLAARAQPKLFADDGVRHPFEEPPPKPGRLDRILARDPTDLLEVARWAKRKGKGR